MSELRSRVKQALEGAEVQTVGNKDGVLDRGRWYRFYMDCLVYAVCLILIGGVLRMEYDVDLVQSTDDLLMFLLSPSK